MTHTCGRSQDTNAAAEVQPSSSNRTVVERDPRQTVPPWSMGDDTGVMDCGRDYVDDLAVAPIHAKLERRLSIQK